MCFSDKSYLYAIGGNNGSASLESCERYDPHLNKWTLIMPMNKRRAGSGVAELNGYLYVVGQSFIQIIIIIIIIVIIFIIIIITNS